MTIWKFEVRPYVPTEMPDAAMILSAAFQGDSLMVWAVVDEVAETMEWLSAEGWQPLMDPPDTWRFAR